MELLFFIVGGILLGIFLEVKFGNKTKDNLSNISVPPEAIIFRCPRCHSTAINANQQGFGVGKAAIGAVAFGPIGLLAGGFGSKKVKITCLQCGHQWAPNSSEIKWDQEYQKTEYQMKHVPKISIAPNPNLRYLKRSVYNEYVKSQIISFNSNAQKTEEFLKVTRDYLTQQQILVISDEEFYRVTGQR